jgi:hypothetical protein
MLTADSNIVGFQLLAIPHPLLKKLVPIDTVVIATGE